MLKIKKDTKNNEIIKIHMKNLSDYENDKFLHIHNKRFIENNNLIFTYGGAGSGKSMSCGLFVLELALMYPKTTTLCLRRYAKDLRNSCYMNIKNWIEKLELQSLFKIYKGELKITCYNGSEIIFLGADDDKIKSISGVNNGIVNFAFVEEADQLKKIQFEQLRARLRGKNKYPFTIIASFNPVSGEHWLKKNFFDEPSIKKHIIHSTYKDNKFIDDKYIELLENFKITNPLYYRIYCLGEWGVFTKGKQIFTNYEVKNVNINDFDQVIHGIDFGYVHPSTCISVGLKDDDIYILNEIYFKGLTNKEFIQEIKKEIKNWKYASFVCDSAEPDRLKEFRQEGFLRINPVNKGKIGTVGSLKASVEYIRDRKVYIHPSCKHTIEEFQTYSYAEDSKGNPLDEFININDDCIAGIRYSLMNYVRKNGGKIKIVNSIQ